LSKEEGVYPREEEHKNPSLALARAETSHRPGRYWASMSSETPAVLGDRMLYGVKLKPQIEYPLKLASLTPPPSLNAKTLTIDSASLFIYW
jgi:hypothetical protein